jgi:hypothetical protein
VLSKTRLDAKKFGYTKDLSKHLLQFDSPERRRRVVAMMAELENWLIGCEHLAGVDDLVKTEIKNRRKCERKFLMKSSCPAIYGGNNTRTHLISGIVILREQAEMGTRPSFLKAS